LVDAGNFVDDRFDGLLELLLVLLLVVRNRRDSLAAPQQVFGLGSITSTITVPSVYWVTIGLLCIPQSPPSRVRSGVPSHSTSAARHAYP